MICTAAYADADVPKIPSTGISKLEVVNVKPAQSVEIEDGFKGNRLNELSPIVLKESLEYKGEKYPLYVTFNEPQNALETFKVKYSGLLSEFESKYNIDELTKGNWSTYQRAFYNNFEDFLQGRTKQETKDIFTILGFFDIYENDQHNSEIKSLVKQRNDKIQKSILKTSVDSDNQTLLNLTFMLPQKSADKLSDNVTISKISYTDSNTVSYYAASGCGGGGCTPTFNVSKAVEYAKKHATSPNETDYRYFDGADCTNFVSQCIKAGGVPMDDTWWYYRAGNSLTWMFDDWSLPWSVADDFVRYFRPEHKTRDHATFSKRLEKGSAICADFGSDDDWDHLGYIVEMGSQNSDTSMNYKVAQHTGNYIKWSSDTSWKSIGVNGGTYASIWQFI